MSTPEQNAALVDVRVADAKFVLDQVAGLDVLAPDSVLAGHLDLQRVAMVGHSLGGAAAVRMLAEDDRIDAAVNIDGRMFTAPGLDRPFLWVENQQPPTRHPRTRTPAACTPTWPGCSATSSQVSRRRVA